MPAPSAAHWKIAFLLGVASFLSFCYFYEGGGWNQNSRFDLLRAIVEQHTLTIDAYHENTGDKAHYKGHYYSDKAPGLVFLALPFVETARAAMRLDGIDPQSVRAEYALSYLSTVCAVGLPMALAAVCLFFLSLRLGASAEGSAIAIIVMSIGTPLLAYSSLFWAHALVGGCFVFAFATAMKLGETRRNFFWWALLVGLSIGWAVVTEYPAAPVSALLAVFALTQVWHAGSSARWRVVTGLILGSAICAAVLFGYLYAAFGGLRPSYSYYDPTSFSFMQQQGYLGLTYPHPDRLLKLLFGCSRGLFFASPVMAGAVAGLWILRKTYRWPAILAGVIVLYYFLFNASFYWWKAGLAFGPRYAGACIPILCLGVAVAWTRVSTPWRAGLMVLALVSVFVTLMVVSTSSQLAMQDSCPIVHSSWPDFWAGHIATNRESMLLATEAMGGYAAFNLGQLIGLHGKASLVPLIAMWGLVGLLCARLMRRE